MATATFVQDGKSIDYTPVAAVAAGDVVVLGNIVGVAKLDIAASKLGALAIEGVFDVAKATGSSSAITAGSKVYWDAVSEVATTTAGSNKCMGYAIKDAGDDDATVRVKLERA